MHRLHEIAVECIPFLNGKWRYLENEAWTEYRQRAVLQDDTAHGRRIILSDYYGGEGRLEVMGVFPDRWSETPRITVAMSRSIPAISADINRRFLPVYLKEWEKAKALYDEGKERQEDLRIRVNLLKHIVPSMRPSWHSHKEVATDYYLSKGKLRLSPYDDNVHLEIKLSFDQLVRVLHLLKE